MRIPLLLAGAQLRRGWKSYVGLVVLIGISAGLVLAGLAGAQRTRTAVDRMIEATDPPHVLINPSQGDESALDFDQMAALPMVEQFSRIHGVLVAPTEPADSINEWFTGPFTMSNDGAAGVDFARPVLADGRMIDPAAVDEVYLDHAFADEHGLRVGDRVTWRLPSGEDLAAAFATDDEAQALAVLNDPDLGATVDLEVVGIGTELDGVAVDIGYEPVSAIIPAALYESLGEPSAGYGGALVRLADVDDTPAFKAVVDRLVPNEKIVYQTLAVSRDKALRATQPAATALAIFAIVALLLGTLLVGQAISRRFQLDSADNDVLASLGTTQSERFLAAMCRLTVVAAFGATAAIVVAAALSPFTPVGPARLAEIDPGFAIAVPIVIGGAALSALIVIIIGLLPAWRYTRQHDLSVATRGSAVAGWLTELGASPQVTTGVRFGLEPGRGRTAVPTRATIIGAVTAVAVAVATVVFASSLDRVVDDGRFYGSNYDTAFDFDDDAATMGDASTVAAVLATVADLPNVDHVGEVRIGEVTVDGTPLTTLSFSDNAEAVEPTIAAGRVPVDVDEIALGATTMDAAGVTIGDVVALRTAGFEGDAKVVGRVVLPGVGLYQGSDRTSIGVGGLVVSDALGERDSNSKGFVAVDLAPGTDVAEFEQAAAPALGQFGLVRFQTGSRPSEIESLSRLRSLPVVLAALLVLLVAMTVVHSMAVAVRRRRRDLAILQALGANRRGVIGVGVWQGLTIGVAAIIFGVPIGIVIGRWLWIALANGFGTLAEPVVPALALGVVAAGVVALAAMAGLVPVMRGLRHQPGEVLRTE